MTSERMSIRGDSTRNAPIRRVVPTLLRFAIGAGLLVYLAKSGIVDFRALSKLFTAWRITFAAVTLLLIDSALMSVRLSWLFRPQGLNLRFGTSLKLALVGFFLPPSYRERPVAIFQSFSIRRGEMADVGSRL